MQKHRSTISGFTLPTLPILPYPKGGLKYFRGAKSEMELLGGPRLGWARCDAKRRRGGGGERVACGASTGCLPRLPGAVNLIPSDIFGFPSHPQCAYPTYPTPTSRVRHRNSYPTLQNRPKYPTYPTHPRGGLRFGGASLSDWGGQAFERPMAVAL